MQIQIQGKMPFSTEKNAIFKKCFFFNDVRMSGGGQTGRYKSKENLLYSNATYIHKSQLLCSKAVVQYSKINDNKVLDLQQKFSFLSVSQDAQLTDNRKIRVTQDNIIYALKQMFSITFKKSEFHAQNFPGQQQKIEGLPSYFKEERL